MPITTNSGGVLHNLSPIYARNGGILNELSTVYARNGGVLSTIYEKNSGGGGGGGESGGGEVTPPVNPTKTETFHWGNYTGTANTTPVCIGNFTIDESMNCTYKVVTFHNMGALCPTPTEYNVLPGHADLIGSGIYDYYYYMFNIYIKKTMNVDGYNNVSWEYPNMESCRVVYKLNKNTGIFEKQGASTPNEFDTSTPKSLEKGTYYVYFSNYIGLYTWYKIYMSGYGEYKNFVKYMPWDNMSVDVTLTLKPIT